MFSFFTKQDPQKYTLFVCDSAAYLYTAPEEMIPVLTEMNAFDTRITLQPDDRDPEKMIDWAKDRIISVWNAVKCIEPPHGYERILNSPENDNTPSTTYFAVTRWKIHGSTRPIEARSPMQEMDILVWIIACSFMRMGLTCMRNGKISDAMINLSYAACAFQWRASTAPNNAQAEYVAEHAPHMHMHAAVAMENACVAFCALCEAELSRRKDDLGKMTYYHILGAKDSFTKALEWANNDTGPDNMNSDMTSALEAQIDYCGRWEDVYKTQNYFKEKKGDAASEILVMSTLQQCIKKALSRQEQAEVEKIYAKIISLCTSYTYTGWAWHKIGASSASATEITLKENEDGEEARKRKPKYDAKSFFISIINK